MPAPDVALPEIALEESTEGALVKLTWDVVNELDLPGISLANRVIRRTASFEGLDFPAVVVRFFDESIDPDAGPSGSDDLTFACMVSIVAANKDQHAGDSKLGTLMAWRSTIRRAFHNHRLFTGISSPTLPTYASLNRTFVKPGQAYIDPALRAGYDAQFLLIGYEIRESRQAI